MRPYAAIFTLMVAILPGAAESQALMEPLPPVPVFEPLYPEQAARPVKVTAFEPRLSNRPFPQSLRTIPPAASLARYSPPATTAPAAIQSPLASSTGTKLTSFAQPTPPLATGLPFVLPGNTAIALRLESSLSSRESRRGDSVRLNVVHDVMLDGRVVVPRGTPAIGEIVRSNSSGGFGKGGKIEIAAKSLLLNGRAVELSGSLLEKGSGGKAGKMLLFGVLSGAIGLAQVRGDDAVIGPETTLDATTREDVAFN